MKFTPIKFEGLTRWSHWNKLIPTKSCPISVSNFTPKYQKTHVEKRIYQEVSTVRVKHTLLLNYFDLETILRRFGNHFEELCDLETETTEEIFPESPIVSREITSVSIYILIPNRSPANPSPFRSIFPVWFIFNKHAKETWVVFIFHSSFITIIKWYSTS